MMAIFVQMIAVFVKLIWQVSLFQRDVLNLWIERQLLHAFLVSDPSSFLNALEVIPVQWRSNDPDVIDTACLNGLNERQIQIMIAFRKPTNFFYTMTA